MIALMRIATDVRSDAKRSQNELLIPSASLLMGDLPTMPKDGAIAHSQRNGLSRNGFRIFVCSVRELAAFGRFGRPPRYRRRRALVASATEPRAASRPSGFDPSRFQLMSRSPGAVGPASPPKGGAMLTLLRLPF